MARALRIAGVAQMQYCRAGGDLCCQQCLVMIRDGMMNDDDTRSRDRLYQGVGRRGSVQLTVLDLNPVALQCGLQPVCDRTSIRELA